MNGFVVSASSAIAFLRSRNAALPDLALTGHGQLVDSAMMAAPEHQISAVLRPVSSEGFLKTQHLKHYFCDLCKWVSFHAGSSYAAQIIMARVIVMLALPCTNICSALLQAIPRQRWHPACCRLCSGVFSGRAGRDACHWQAI